MKKITMTKKDMLYVEECLKNNTMKPLDLDALIAKTEKEEKEEHENYYNTQFTYRKVFA